MTVTATDRGPEPDGTAVDLDAFRHEIRTFLAEKLTPDLRDAAAMQSGIFCDGEVMRAWHTALYEQGWIAPAWPREYGGPGWSPMQRMIFEAECAEAGAPLLPGMSLQMCGPVLMRFGTVEQKRFFLPRILSGEHFWCQGYSEPQAGSDLASLQCAAVRDGDEYVINGTKIWTTFAHRANWLFLLARTSKEGRKQAGISFLLVPMDSPGLTVVPILSMSGDHEVNQLFFDNVRIAASSRVGDENEGWTIAKYLLEFERGGGWASGRARRVLGWLDAVGRRFAAEGRDFGGARYRHRRAALDIDVMALEWTQRRYIAATQTGASIGDASASVLKLTASGLFQRATELALDALGTDGALLHEDTDRIGPRDFDTRFAARYLNARAISIFGGSSEIQHGIIARVALGL